MRNSTFEVLRDGSLPGDFIPREISNEAKKGEQQRHNSPQLTLSFLRCAFSFYFLFLSFFVESRSRCTLRVYCNNSNVLPLPARREAKSEKRDIRSLSRKRRARSRCLSFLYFCFFFPSLLRHRVIRH